jgi:hypothetical protein
MKSTRYGLLATITAFSACGALLAPVVATAQEQVSQETEILTRGPVHEAFAEAVSFEPEPGILISVQPPEAIDELPPEQELEGDNVTWIPGYWAWDEENNDFLWISGIWRNIPPDREWVPGYWNEVGNQYQWVAGYWADSGTEEVAYLPEPPRSIEAGPNVEATSDNDVWIPGTWIWADTRYRWRPGYYQPYRQDWTYIPDHYNWSPRGYIYVPGYWDYVVARRGVIFAPVRFHGHIYRRPDFYYTPVTVISLNLFVDHLFVRPRYNHYYFGDYYEPAYRDRGFFYNVNYARMRGGYDPIYAHRRWEHRHDGNWERSRLADFDYFRDNRDARPPRTWAGLRDIGDGRRGFKGRDGKDLALATPLSQFAKNNDGGRKFRKLEGGAREKIVNQRQQMVNFAKQRKQVEKEAAVGKAVEGEAAPKAVRAKLQRSPIMGRKAAQLSGDQAPPKRKQAPAVLDKDPVDDNRPGRPGRGQQGGKEAADDDTTKPQPQPGRPGRGQGGKGDKEPMTDRDTPAKPEGGRDTPPKRGPKVTPAPKKADPQPERQVQPKKEQAQPKRQVQPKKEQAPPKRQVQPKKEQTQPQRQVQPKKEQAQPQRQVQPKKEQAQPKRQQAQPQRQAQPKKEQAQPQRQAQPKRQQAQPQRQVQPKKEQAQPQRAQPQRPQKGKGKEKEE